MAKARAPDDVEDPAFLNGKSRKSISWRAATKRAPGSSSV